MAMAMGSTGGRYQPKPAPAPTRRRSISLGRLALQGAAGLSLAFILLPLVFVIWLSVFAQEIPSFPPEGYSLKWFAAIPGQKAFVDGFILSLQVAVAATLLGLALGVPASLALMRHRIRFGPVLNALLLLPLVLPGIVLGAALYIAEIEAEIATGFPFIGSLAGLVFAHALVVVPWVVRLVTASLAGFDRSIEEAAQNLGANPWVTFWRVTLPSIRPGLVAASLFAFVTSLGNLEMSLFLVGPGQTTFPIAILQYLEWKIDPTVAAASVVQILVIAAALLITDRYVKLSRVV